MRREIGTGPMPSVDPAAAAAAAAAESRGLLAERISRAGGLVAQVPELLEPLLERPQRLPRLLVTTGIGTSEGHARHLAEVAVRYAGQPARFAATGSLQLGAPPGCEQDWLVVFSQGLSENARFALRDVEAWAGVVLICGLPRPGAAGFEALPVDKQTWLRELEARGVVQVELGCDAEYGLLIRVLGARLGYGVGWSLLRTLAARRLETISGLEADGLDLDEAQERAIGEARRAFPMEHPAAEFFAAERSLLLVAEGGALELASHLALKIAEGMLRPTPICVDVLGFAHGPLQSIAGRPASILYLAGPADRESEQDWQARLERTLDPEWHELRVLRATTPLPFSVLEYEAALDELILRSLWETGLDLARWPGADREDALYRVGPELPAVSPTRAPARSALRSGRAFLLEEAVWTELEGPLAAGRSTALIPLGSIEQHGPHLPLGSDRWIADALARGLAERRPESVALPALPFGCASEHMGFPGTLHLAPATLEALLADLLASLATHGFERAFVFSAHGGNVEALSGMRARLASRVPSLVLGIEQDLEAVARMQRDAVASRGLEAESAGPHAGEFETSLVAALRPGSVRRSALAVGRRTAPDEAQALFYPSLRARVESGVLGDPRQASAGRAGAYLEAWVDLLETAYRNAFEAPRSSSGGSEKKRA
jgi:creatinine amidohydrolase